MNLLQSEEHLSHSIRQFGRKLKESRQVKARLKELLPTRLAQLKSRHRKECRAAEAQRRALTDPIYHGHIEELLQVSRTQMLNQIEYDSHRMLWQARQSLRAAWLVRNKKR